MSGLLLFSSRLFQLDDVADGFLWQTDLDLLLVVFSGEE